MIDVLAEGLRAAATRSAAAYPLLALAGAASSVGPCVAPRAIAVAALAQRSRRPARVIAAFVTGVLATSLAVAAGAGAVAASLGTSRIAYVLLAATLAVAGVATLASAHGARCTAHAHERATSGLGGVALLGATSALVVSPCCTPALAAIAGLTAARGGEGIALAGAFACGHAAPLIGAGIAGARVTSAMRRLASAQAPAIVSGTLMLALAAFYGALA
ncbi:MAG TPA: cytochrome c biogenesis protein CcdA [Candidatus Elarobacter sp.]|nr:cytochrome c biogenesis protein CcdA [Candidatus Elarobacter sp.]